jgi:predicted ribonuclease YlaK
MLINSDFSLFASRSFSKEFVIINESINKIAQTIKTIKATILGSVMYLVPIK